MLHDTEFTVAPQDQPAWANGKHAAERGDTLEACPYSDGSRRDAWLVAWLLTQTWQDWSERYAPSLD